MVLLKDQFSAIGKGHCGHLSYSIFTFFSLSKQVHGVYNVFVNYFYQTNQNNYETMEKDTVIPAEDIGRVEMAADPSEGRGDGPASAGQKAADGEQHDGWQEPGSSGHGECCEQCKRTCRRNFWTEVLRTAAKVAGVILAALGLSGFRQDE